METSRPVVIRRVPDRLNQRSAKAFLMEMEPLLRKDRPQIVLDLSQVRQMDAAGIDMLLKCMSEAMRRDGDVKLASLTPQASFLLELTRTDRLFECFDTATDAARSFHGFYPNVMDRNRMEVARKQAAETKEERVA